MAVVKTYPAPLSRVRNQFDRMFDRVFNREYPFPDFESDAMWNPSLDFSETDTEFMVSLDVPGIPKENLDVKVEQNVLTVSGHRESSKEEKDDQFIWRERETGRFMRSVRLPAAIADDKIHAKVDDGVLQIRMPKAEPAAKAKILIK